MPWRPGARDLIEAFAADVAHEIKNPLTSIRSALETLPLVKTEAQREKLTALLQQDGSVQAGFLGLASDQLEFYDNDIKDNNTVGMVVVNYGLADPSQSQLRYDFFPEGTHIYGNTFTNNGSNPQLPDPERSTCTGPNGLPGPGDDPQCLGDNAGLLVTIIQLKNGGKSAQIIWDGATDTANDCDTIPVDSDGIPLNQPNPNETRAQRYEARMDERGRPNLYQYDPEPVCKYNAWKFNADGTLRKPQNGICVENNTFNKTTPQALLVDDYANIKFGTPDPTDPANLEPVDNTIPTECPIVEPALLPQFVPVLGSYTPNPANDPRPSEAELASVCNGGAAGQINHAALARYNCPRLDQYNLFADAQDPTQNPNGFGVPFDLNTILFSDYASKYRFLFLPPASSGEPQKAVYMDHEDCETLNVYDCYTATLGFPVGTVFAKTFAFKDGEQENVVETRLLIKRQKQDGSVHWVGLPYVWTGSGAARVAQLKIEGGTAAVEYDYVDPDPDVKMDWTHNSWYPDGKTIRMGIYANGDYTTLAAAQAGKSSALQLGCRDLPIAAMSVSDIA